MISIIIAGIAKIVLNSKIVPILTDSNAGRRSYYCSTSKVVECPRKIVGKFLKRKCRQLLTFIDFSVFTVVGF